MIAKTGAFVASGWKSSSRSLKDSVTQAPPALARGLKRGLLGMVVLLILIVVVKEFRLIREERRRAAEIAAGPRIRTAKVVASSGEHTLQLVGETRAYQETTLYATVSGYLRSVKVDKGDQVREGQVLAIIESPETDQAYQAALSDAKNKRAIAERMVVLRAKKLVSEQENDQARADTDVAAARLRSAETLKGYETLRAPFAGTITARFADPGALLQNATNAQSSALSLVTIATVNRLRVDVFVDQHDAPFVRNDDAVEITLNDRPGFQVAGQVARVSGELDPHTKMLLTEIDVDNRDGQIVPGSSVQVALRIKAPAYVQAPVESLVMKGGKSFLTAVDPDDRLHFKPVEVASNDGKVIWISGGAAEGDVVALNVGDTIPEGGKVRPTPEK